MGLDPSYQPLYQQARDLQFQVHDALDDPNHPTAFVLKQEMQHLMDDIEVQRNPRDLENRIKIIQHSMLEARTNPNSFMDSQHADYFHHNYEQMRQNVRRFSNY
jgi:hypothetical protein